MYEWFQCPFCNLFWFFSPAIWICFQTSVCLCEPMWGECADRDHSRSHYQRLQPINVKEMGPTRHSNTNIPENNCSQYNVHHNQNLFLWKADYPCGQSSCDIHVNVFILFENVIHILLDSADFLIQIHITFASFSRYCLLIHIVIFYIL